VLVVVIAAALLTLGFTMPRTASATVPGANELVSVDSSGNQSNGNSYSHPGSGKISGDGRYVVFDSTATNLVSGVTSGTDETYTHDMQTGATTLVSVAADGTPGNSGSEFPAVNADGRYVVFESYSSNLVNGVTHGQIYLKDTQTGAVQALSVNSSGVQGNDESSLPVISCGGNEVAFQSKATNLVSGDTNEPISYLHSLS
jgi:Tol biopolymer transport system component